MSPLPEILDDAVTRTVYATDNSIYQIEPAGVALPYSGAEIAALLADNHRSPKPRPIVARGAGTGTNGQSLTDGLIIDLKRRLDRIISIEPQPDPDSGCATAVVEPGVVTARLNAELAPHGLFWAPHASTINRATVGGMIATDAAGKGSLVHGRAHRHVLALDVILDDGTPWRAEPLPRVEAEERATSDDRIGRLWRDLLAIPLTEGADYGLPELARGFSGYGIDRVHRDGLVDPIPLLCGSEGTLAVIVAATLRLTPLPAKTVLMVASYASFADALDDAVDLAVTKPTAIESFDETTLERGRSSVAWPALGAVVGEHTGSVLLLEYSGDHEPDLAPIVATLARTGRSRATKAITDPATRAAAWKVRADAVGLLAKVASGGPERSARPTAFVEDCAVPVRQMPAFIAGFRAVLDEFGLEYGMFGHADVGCVHVRPALDLTDPTHEVLLRTVTDRVVELVADHGGVLWGEHGRGLRGDSAAAFLTPETIELMRRVKAAFDPQDLLNPGKLYRPAGVDEAIIAVDGAPLRGHQNRKVALSIRQEYADAFACNGNGLCHHYAEAEVMCPSYKATKDPALSPNGRADLIRAWLTGTPSTGEGLDDALAENLNQCLSCSACAGHCPVEVDIPELKSRFFEEYYRTRRRPLSHRLMSRFETLAALGARAPSRLVRLGLPAVERALGLVDLPVPGAKAALAPDIKAFDAARSAGADRPVDIVLLPDVFTSTFEPATLSKAVGVLRALGYSVARAPFLASGKFDHVKGNRVAFNRAAVAQQDLVSAVIAAGAVPVVIEPAVALLHDHEYPTIIDGYPQGTVKTLVEMIEERADRLIPLVETRSVNLLGHCTERALAPERHAGWARVLEGAGYTVTTPEIGCCGMAGVFGHEGQNQELSTTLFDLSWRQHFTEEAAAAAPIVVATGYSCRSQVKRLAGQVVPHPVHLL
ncbi:MAG: FAD-binding oxidoreductase [Actinomycetia bacterium]|nr:FAD-binding oxidoreductase [Actinomycetes bacterium]